MTDTAGADAPQIGKRRGVLRLLLTVLLVVFAIFAVLAVVAMVTRETTREQRTFAAAEVSRITADVSAGALEIVATERDDVALTIVSRSALWAEPQVTVDVGGGTLELTGDCPAAIAFSCGVTFQIEVPTGSILKVESDVSAGHTTVEGIGGAIDARSSAGSITVVDFAGSDVSLRTSAGNVELTMVSVPGTVSAETGAGNVDIVVPDGVYRVDADTTVGNTTVEVRQDPASSNTITAESTTGNVTISNP